MNITISEPAARAAERMKCEKCVVALEINALLPIGYNASMEGVTNLRGPVIAILGPYNSRLEFPADLDLQGVAHYFDKLSVEKFIDRYVGETYRLPDDLAAWIESKKEEA